MQARPTLTPPPALKVPAHDPPPDNSHFTCGSSVARGISQIVWTIAGVRARSSMSLHSAGPGGRVQRDPLPKPLEVRSLGDDLGVGWS